MTTNGNGWKVAIFLAGALLASMAAGSMAYVQVSAVENRVKEEAKSLKMDVFYELKEHGALLRDMDRRLARIEGSLANDRR